MAEDKDIERRIRKRSSLLEQPPEHTTSIWQTVYGDMMTNLMLFFLMMFSLNMVGEDQFRKSAHAFKNTITSRPPPGMRRGAAKKPADRDEVNAMFEKFAGKETNVQVIEQGEGIRLRLPEPVLFDVGEAELKPEARQILHEFAQGLKKLTNQVVVEGHTDDIPIHRGPYESNWQLSEARAENVVDFLVQEEGVPPERLAVAGFGEFWPFVVNDTDENRALNRRIELLVIADEKT